MPPDTPQKVTNAVLASQISGLAIDMAEIKKMLTGYDTRIRAIEIAQAAGNAKRTQSITFAWLIDKFAAPVVVAVVVAVLVTVLTP